MGKVISNRNVHDAAIELRDLQLEINKFQAVKNIAQREIDDLVLSIEDLRKRKKELEETISIPYTDLAQSMAMASKVVNESSLAMEASIKIAEGFLELIKKLSERVESQNEELSIITQKKREAFALISAEEARLSKVKSDLAIYQKRLQKEIDAFGLSEKIKIIL